MSPRVLALSGGVGGAKLAAGLAAILPPDDLLVAVNTGDDFEHLGLTICPDIDSNLYALAGLHDPDRGWGRRDETWQVMQTLGSLHGPTWFQLGDRDLALHLLRTARLRAGSTLTQVTRELANALGIGPRVVPMSDDPVRTQLVTPEGRLDFQDYFVRRRCEPEVQRIEPVGAEAARVQPELLQWLSDPALHCVVLCPSNPWLSVAPMLAMPALREALAACVAPVVAVSPIVGGRALKGPAAKLMGELGLVASAQAIAAHYGPLIQGLLVDERDADQLPHIRAGGCAARALPIVMSGAASQAALAHAVLDFAAALPRGARPAR